MDNTDQPFAPRFRALLQLLYMRSDALETWEKLHIRAQEALVWFFTAAVCSIVLDVVTFLFTPDSGDSSGDSNTTKPAMLIAISMTTIYTGMCWRLGQRFTAMRGAITSCCMFLNKSRASTTQFESILVLWQQYASSLQFRSLPTHRLWEAC
jgi:hypothetical protein